MTTIAPSPFSDAEKKANCAICTLGNVMRECPRCAFFMGKSYRCEDPTETLKGLVAAGAIRDPNMP